MTASAKFAATCGQPYLLLDLDTSLTSVLHPLGYMSPLDFCFLPSNPPSRTRPHFVSSPSSVKTPFPCSSSPLPLSCPIPDSPYLVSGILQPSESLLVPLALTCPARKLTPFITCITSLTAQKPWETGYCFMNAGYASSLVAFWEMLSTHLGSWLLQAEGKRA